jgi:hypothetical protein
MYRGALLESVQLVRCVADRPAHLPGELVGNLVAPRDERIDRTVQDGRALGDRNLAPGRLSSFGPIEGGGDLALACQLPLGVDLAVNRRDHADFVVHRRPPMRSSGGR